MITHKEAREIARRLIAGSFRRDGERLDAKDQPRFSIPCRPEHDDDTRLLAYIEQQERFIEDAFAAHPNLDVDVERHVRGNTEY